MVYEDYNRDEILTSFAKSLTRAYFAGLRKGLWMYAWWKDGTQYIGTTGVTLKNALEEMAKIEEEELERL